MAKVGIGIVGVGNMGRAHAEGFGEVEEAELVAVTDPARFEDAGPEFAARYGLE